jgi:DNA-binding response OmpR family regulator
MSTKVLIVDDCREMRELLKAFMESSFEVAVAEDGLAALKVLDGQRFHLIITDYNMPNMDGLILSKNVKQKWPQTPIIMMSALAYTINSSENVDALLDKPFSMDVLLKVVNTILSNTSFKKGQ